MSSFDERQKSFEKKFAHDEELQFKGHPNYLVMTKKKKKTISNL